MANLLAEGRLVQINGSTQVVLRVPGNPVEQYYTVSSIADLTAGPKNVAITASRKLGVYDDQTIYIVGVHYASPKTK